MTTWYGGSRTRHNNSSDGKSLTTPSSTTTTTIAAEISERDSRHSTLEDCKSLEIAPVRAAAVAVLSQKEEQNRIIYTKAAKVVTADDRDCVNVFTESSLVISTETILFPFFALQVNGDSLLNNVASATASTNVGQLSTTPRGTLYRNRHHYHRRNEEDVDSDWVHGVTVAATSPKTPFDTTPCSRAVPLRSDSLRREVLLCRNDSLTQSLHKEITYPAVNVSRKSNSSTESPPTEEGNSASGSYINDHRRIKKSRKDHKRVHKSTLAPDRFYPAVYQGRDLGTKNSEQKTLKNKRRKGDDPQDGHANGFSGPMETQLTPYHDISATVGRGWYSCFKNNNYLFVRNWKGQNYYRKSPTEEESPWYRNYDILRSKLHISLEPKPEYVSTNSRDSITETTAKELIIETRDGIAVSPIAVVTSTPNTVPAAAAAASNRRASVIPTSDTNTIADDKTDSPTFDKPPEDGHDKPSANGIEQLTNAENPDDNKKKPAHGQKKGPASWLRKLRTPRKTPRKSNVQQQQTQTGEEEEVGVNVSNEQSNASKYRSPSLVGSLDNMATTDEGPHSSTPREDESTTKFGFNDNAHRSLPSRGKHSGTTPKRLVEIMTVRRRLPYTPVKPYKERKSLDLMSLSPKLERKASRKSLIETFREPSDEGKKSKINQENGTLCRSSSMANQTHEKNASMPEMKIEQNANSEDTESLSKQNSVSAPTVLPDDVKTPAVVELEREEDLSLAKQDESSSFMYSRQDIRMIDDEEEDCNNGGPVTSWLKAVRLTTDGECLNALQAKQISSKDKSLLAAMAVGNAQEAVEKIWDSGICVLEHLKLSRRILEQNDPSSSPTSRWESFRNQVDRFCQALREFLTKKQVTVPVNGSREEASKMVKNFGELMNSVNEDESVIEQVNWKEKTLSEIDSLEKCFRIHLVRMVRPHVKVIVDQLNETSGVICMKRSLYAVILLGRQFGTSLCDIMAQADVMRALLSVCLEKKWRPLQVCALRAMTIVCSSGEAMQKLLECDGMECVTEMLEFDPDAENAQEEEKRRSEAAGVIAQCTAPWSENSSFVLKHQKLRDCGDSLVRCLTDLADKASSSEVFLLATAALANLSLCTEAASRWIPKHNALEVLTNSCRNKKDIAGSLFAMDQVSTVLANCASHPSACRQMAGSPSLLVSLLCFLQVRPCIGHTTSETSSCERLQQKAAITMARMCTSEPRVANDIAEMQGTQRLVKLCKDKKERNDSDSVLVACLAALRKIATVRGEEELKQLNAGDLIDKSLWDAFMAHSSKQESYV